MYDWEEELYLEHHGVKGMKWGVRKKQAKVYQRQLNDLDKEADENISRYMRYSEKTNKYLKKGAKIFKKSGENPTGKTAAKLDKLQEKATSAAKRAKFHDDTRKQIESDTFKLLAKLDGEGFAVNSKQTIRYTEKGRNYMQQFLLGPIGSVAVNVVPYLGKYQYTDSKGRIREQYPGNVQGNRYKVR